MSGSTRPGSWRRGVTAMVTAPQSLGWMQGGHSWARPRDSDDEEDEYGDPVNWMIYFEDDDTEVPRAAMYDAGASSHGAASVDLTPRECSGPGGVGSWGLGDLNG